MPQIYLQNFRDRTLVVMRGMESEARQVAERRRIPVFELVSAAALTGQFELETGARPAQYAEWADGNDVALVLHTSGTTSRAKMVPLTHSNLTSSAQNIRSALKLTSADCCLNMMPLFHIHGLIGAVLSSISAGASIVCTPGFEAPRVMGWLDELQPTWYTAVPTMHQAILARAATNGRTIGRGRLRLIRSSSAALPPQVMVDLKEVFGVPVIESYGMTEATHLMTSNPLPPRARKSGSVGVPAGPEVGVMDANGNLVSPGVTAEVVIRGPNVTEGYENNPEANRAFHSGWFRTGDQGYLDADGYLFLTGRLKETLNRAGEKISPREVDEVLLDHAAVAQAVTFALPDEWLGEDVGAAVVLKAGAKASEIELKEFVASRLADFKVPRRLVILDEIPQGPTGKVQRIALADKLGLTGSESPAEVGKLSLQAPDPASERMLCRLWEEVLGFEGVSVSDDFFRLGGDSVLAVRFLARLREKTGAELSLVRFFDAPTVAAVAAFLGPALQEKSSVETSSEEEEILARHCQVGEKHA